MKNCSDSSGVVLQNELSICRCPDARGRKRRLCVQDRRVYLVRGKLVGRHFRLSMSLVRQAARLSIKKA